MLAQINQDSPTTHFLPPDRLPVEEVQEDHRQLSGSPEFQAVMEASPVALFFLNRFRQIVAVNEAAQRLSPRFGPAVQGMRVGEFLGCGHAYEPPGGCGTTGFCRFCGAANAMRCALAGGKDVRECRIVKNTGDALDLRVWAKPFEINGAPYMLFAAVDVSDENRRRALERVFFHDILNSAGGLQSFADLLGETGSGQREELERAISQLARQVVDEIHAQRDLTAAERGEYEIEPQAFSTRELLEEITDAFRFRIEERGCRINIADTTEDCLIASDRTLLRRVISNFTKNAMEASIRGESIVLGCDRTASGSVRLWVHNPAVMSRAVRCQVFQRSYSTKGKGRGLGAYGSKMIMERYLQGSVGFTSSEGEGTRFFADCPGGIAPGV